MLSFLYFPQPLNILVAVGGKPVKRNGKNMAIELTPTDKTRPYHKVYVLVDKAANTIYSAKFLEKSGAVIATR